MFRLIAPALLLATSASAATADRPRIEWLIQAIIEAQEAKDMGAILSTTWPEGYYSSSIAGQTGAFSRTPWREFRFSGTGVHYQTRTTRPRISLIGDRATATFEERIRQLHWDEDSGAYSVSRTSAVSVVRTRAEFERRGGEWRVLHWHRTPGSSDSSDRTGGDE